MRPDQRDDVRSRLLIAIPASHYVERARWALDYCGVQYSQSSYIPILHYASTRTFYGQRSVPILDVVHRDGRHEVLRDSQRIVRYADDHRLLEKTPSPLYPPGREAAVAEWETLFADVLGPHVRRYAYWVLFQPEHKAVALDTLCGKQPGIGLTQKLLLSATYPAFRAFMSKGMNITEKTADKSLAVVRQIFDRVSDSLVQDGRQYLLGDDVGFTAADLTFAAMASLVVFPPSSCYPGAYFPSFTNDIRVEPYRSQLLALRSSPAGQLALRMYERHRGSTSFVSSGTTRHMSRL